MVAAYSGAEFEENTKKAVPSAAAKTGLFVFFVFIRAVHPTVIQASKSVDENGATYFAYGPQTANLAEVFISMMVAQLVALKYGQWRHIWRWEPLRIFTLVGFLFGLGDYLEMRSMVALGSGSYQILLQSRLLITALMLWAVSGKGQSLFQWNLLALVVCSMSVYMCLDMQSTGSGNKLLGTLSVVLKVAVSCLAAVLTDRYTKHFADPVYIQAIQLRCSRCLLLGIFVCLDGQTVQQGFFHGWDACTVWVAITHLMKAWSTLYLLVYLDSVLKNLGESLAVLVTYLIEVLLPTFDTPFHLRTLLVVVVVMLSVNAYISSKGVVAKAEKLSLP
ncbi:unnamed protein product [Effrenium voratum]|nr:unnamed protein product [Effrenium voratum]